jgi:hypothetical protein
LVRVESTPSGAEVWVDGVREGLTPLDLRRARAESPSVVELRSSGRAVAKKTVVPNADQKLVFELPPNRTPARAGAEGAAPRGAAPQPKPWAKWN